MDVPKFRAYASEPFLASINAGAAQGTFRAIAFGQQMQVSYLRSRQSGFVYLSLMPVEQYTRSMMAASMQGLLVGLVAAAAAVLVSIGYSMRFSRPIEMLRAAMNRAATGDLTVRADYRRTDDFSQITDGFNHMIGRIQQLMQDLKTEELLLKEAELRNLQAQVNPHFLYNTLETIHWMAGLNRTKEVKELSMSLASFYRATLSQGRKTVTARESFDMIREYLAILTARYGERFTATYDEPPELDNEQVLHLVLQPLVENAIQHSIERVAYHVNLYIGIREDGGDLIMTVHDDGAGIDGETLARIRATLDDETQSPEGFALQNVHRRIRLMYGDRYGLEIESEQGNYTRVSARMKKLTGETNV